MTYRPMLQPNSDPALDAALAYRMEVLKAAGRATRTRRGAWFRNRRRPR